MLKDFGNKKDLESFGHYMIEIMRTRSSSEVPKVLSSKFLPEYDPGFSPLDRITKDPVFVAAHMGIDVPTVDNNNNAESGEDEVSRNKKTTESNAIGDKKSEKKMPSETLSMANLRVTGHTGNF